LYLISKECLGVAAENACVLRRGEEGRVLHCGERGNLNREWGIGKVGAIKDLRGWDAVSEQARDLMEERRTC